MDKNKLTLTLIILVVIGAFFVFSNTNKLGLTGSTTEIDKLSICLSKNAVMYGSDLCSHCIQQKELFEESFKYINYIDCIKSPAECLNANIERYPTWVINSQKYEGVKTLQELKELSNC